MHHGLSRAHLYSAVKLVATFSDEYGNLPRRASGTGFWVRRLDGLMCLITNRHMVDPLAQPFRREDPANFRFHRLSELELTYFRSGKGPPGSIVDRWQIHAFGSTVAPADTEEDVVCFIDPTVQAPDGDTAEVQYSIPEEMLADEEFFASLEPCDFVAFPGYPHWHDTSVGRPVIRVGTIASDPSHNYEFGDVRGQCVAYEAFSTGGCSGSPVFSLQKGTRGIKLPDPYRPARVVGINAGHLSGGGHHHGHLSYFYKSTLIRMLVQAEPGQHGSGGLSLSCRVPENGRPRQGPSCAEDEAPPNQPSDGPPT
ncbi:MAG: hypothetical protein AB7N76_00050 [Planctomycetota bacterium]